MTTQIKFRPLGQGDSGRIKELLSNFKECREDIDISELIADPKCHCVVGEVDDKVVCFGALVRYITPSKGEVGRIEDVIVDEEYRGKGYGKAMLQELISIASEENLCQIDMTSKRIRTEAHELYESLGFIMRESDIFRLKL